MPNWPDNEVWKERDTYNRAPRPALTECTPSRRINPRCVRYLRGVVKFILFGGFLAVTMLGLFYFAR